MIKYRYIVIGLLIFLSIVVLTTIGIRYAEPATDGDIWFHLAYGRYFVENHCLTVDHSIFSWTPADSLWVYCAWIPESVFYLLYKLWGVYGLYAIRYLFILIFTLFVLSLAVKKESFLPSTLLICLCGLLMAQAGLRLKADLFSFFFMTTLIFLWFRIKINPDKSWHLLYIFPVLFLIWANSHPGFIFGGIFLGLVLTGEIINWLTGSSEKLKQEIIVHLFISIALSMVAVFITPYGWIYLAHMLNELIFSSKEFYKDTQSIMEYLSIFYPGALHLHFIDYLIVSSGIFVILLFIQIKRHRTDWTVLLVNAFFMILYMKYLRLTYYWAIIFVFSSMYLLRRISESDPEISFKMPLRLATQIITVCLLLFYSLRAQYDTFCSPIIGFNGGYDPPTTEAQYIRSNFPSLQMGNDYDCGTYLLWSLWPEKKVFIDARNMPYLNWKNEYTKFINSEDKISKDLFIKKYTCDLWCLSYHDPNLVKYFLGSSDWRLVYYGPTACIFLSKRIYHAEGHKVSNAINNVNFYDALLVSHFAFLAGDIQVAKRLVTHLSPCVFCPEQKKLAFNTMSSFGDLLYSKQFYKDSIDLYSEAIKVDPKSSVTYFKKGNAECKINKFTDAINSYHMSLSIKPDYDQAYNNLGNVFIITNHLDDAAKCYSEALRINPHNVDAMNNLKLAEDHKKLDASISHLLEELKTHPNDRKIISLLSFYYARKGDYTNSLTNFKRLLSLNPKDPDVYYNIACLYAKMNEINNSIKWLDMAIIKGFNKWSTIKEDIDLNNIRQTAFYKQLIQNH